MATKIRIAEPNIKQIYDAITNDSSKSWMVPDREQWKINFGHIILASTATAGNRLIQMEVQDDSSNIILDVNAGAVQPASQTYHYVFMQGIYRETAFTLNEMQVPVPTDLFLKPGWTITIHDANAIAAAADDLTVALQYEIFNIGS